MDSVIDILDRQFAQLFDGWQDVIQELNSESIYRKLDANSRSLSCGEHIVRSARIVEQTFGGITTNLWDDPFEWTLPEALKTSASVAGYLNEVEATRARGFALFSSDEELRKEIATPSGEMKSLFTLLVETLERAAHHQGRAFATFRL